MNKKKSLIIFYGLLTAIFSFLTSSFALAENQAKAAEQGNMVEDAPSLERMLGAMLMIGFRGFSLEDKDPFLEKIRQGEIGGVILFDKDVSSNGQRNIQSPEQLRKLSAQLAGAAPAPIFIAIDQEGGQVRRLRPQKGFMDLPSAQAMGQGNSHDTFATAEKLGAELHNLGINVDLAPVVDVDSNPYNPVIGRLGRAFNSDSLIVAQHALAFGQGLAKMDVIPVLKHFPGQGCGTKDSHMEALDVSACWNANVDLLPYAEILKAGWPGMVMTGHILHKELDGNLPASLSRNIIDGLLRKGLGWEGVVISDDLQMKAASQGRDLKEIIFLAIDAGNDILLFGNNLEWDEALPEKVIQALQELVAEKIITEERVRESWRRISSLAEVYGLFALNSQTENGDQPVQEKSQPKPKEDDNNDHADELVRQIGS